MFPYSYNKLIRIPIEEGTAVDMERILLKFNDQFDAPKLIDNTISFENFNVALKRHSWLSEGTLNLIKEDNRIKVSLFLSFQTTTLLLVIISIVILGMNYKEIGWALLGLLLLWSFYSLLYLWTTTMYKASIKRTIKHQLFLMQSGLD